MFSYSEVTGMILHCTFWCNIVYYLCLLLYLSQISVGDIGAIYKIRVCSEQRSDPHTSVWCIGQVIIVFSCLYFCWSITAVSSGTRLKNFYKGSYTCHTPFSRPFPAIGNLSSPIFSPPVRSDLYNTARGFGQDPDEDFESKSAHSRNFMFWLRNFRSHAAF